MREVLNQINWRDHMLTLWQLGAAFLLLIGAASFYINMQSDLREQQRIYESVQFDADQSEANEFILQDHLEDYQSLVERGYIGTPQRLQWLESLREIGQRYDIPGIEFTLESSLITEQGVDPFWHPEVIARATEMTVDLQMTHEGDLYRFFNTLRDEAQGMFSIESCRLRWLDSFSEDMTLTRFRGNCQLRWYTLVEVTQQTGQIDEL